jgi:hypothetical protein
MVSKWRFIGLENYVVGEDNKIYKLPFTSNKRYYNFREIKEQYPQRFRLNGSWYTKQLLRKKLQKDLNPIIIHENISDCPF